MHLTGAHVGHFRLDELLPRLLGAYGHSPVAIARHTTSEGHKWLDVAARRVSRGRGHAGFGNARAILTCFEGAYTAALKRDSKATELWTVDFIGEPPTCESRPALKAALDDLDKLVGRGNFSHRNIGPKLFT